MSHTTADEEAAGRAALYALGALEGEEARDFEEHVAAGCGLCAAELRGFQGVVADLALAVPEAEPPAHVRARLLAHVSGGVTGGESAPDAARIGGAGPRREAAPDFLILRAGEGEWRPTADAGVSYKLLFADRGRGTVTTLVRMEPGSRIRPHRHVGVEQCLVLEGNVSSGGVGMGAGDFNCSMPGSVHEELVTERGALLLLVSPERYEEVEPRAGSGS